MPTEIRARPADAGSRRLAILGYHKIGDPSPGGWETWFYIPEATFVAQLEYLREHGWEVLDLATILRGLEDRALLPERSALLTFDDGYRSMLHCALPCLRRFGFPAVLFVPTAFVGGYNAFDGGAEPDEPICGWEELRELERHGVAVQSHAVSHRGFSTLDAAEQEEELRRSRLLLEERLDRPVELFSFPFGDAGANPEATTELLRRAGYRAACLYGGAPLTLPAAAPFALPRVAMGPDTDLAAALAEVVEP